MIFSYTTPYDTTESTAVADFFSAHPSSTTPLWMASVMLSNGNTADIAAHSIVRSDISDETNLENFVMTSSASTVIPFQSDNLHVLRSSFSPKVLCVIE